MYNDFDEVDTTQFRLEQLEEDTKAHARFECTCPKCEEYRELLIDFPAACRIRAWRRQNV